MSFYSDVILSRRGALGRVWLAAHMERKLSKSQTLQTDIEQSVDAIVGSDVEVLALRLSGQLLLGVVRIYSRKAKYLLDDCNDALLKIKMAFRPGVVDLTEEQLNVNKTTITLQANTVDLDLLLPDVNWDLDFVDRPLRETGTHQAQVEDITLPVGNNLSQFGDDPFNIGPSNGIGSQDFLDVDLGLDWDGAPSSHSNGGRDGMSVDRDDESIGVGRDAASHHSLLDFPQINGASKDIDFDMQSLRSASRGASQAPFQHGMDLDFPDFGGMDLGDLGIGFDQPAEEPTKLPSSRGSSPLTEIPDTPVADETALPEVPTEATPKAPKKTKERKQVIDTVTELYDNPSRANDVPGALKDVSNITTAQRFLPRSTLAMRLQTIRDDPLAHFFPTKSKDNTTFFAAGPPGLSSELSELFMRPLATSTQKRRYVSVEGEGNKRLRLDAGEDEMEVEAVRRATSVAGSVTFSEKFGGHPGDDADMTGDFSFGDQMNALDDNFQLDIPQSDHDVGIPAPVDLELPRARSVSVAASIARSLARSRSRMSTPGMDGWMEGEESYADLSCPIAMFDARQTQTQTQDEQGADVSSQVPSEEVVVEEKGYSKNTVKALTFIRKELQPAPEVEQEPVMKFNTVATKASRRAASSFFFELLVLGTRDCVKLDQGNAYQDIDIRSKPKLWQAQTHTPTASELPSMD